MEARKLICLISAGLLFLQTGFASANLQESKNFESFVVPNIVFGEHYVSPLLIYSNDVRLVHSNKPEVRMKINASVVYHSEEDVSSFKVKVYKVQNDERKLVNSQNFTVKNMDENLNKDFLLRVRLGTFERQVENYEFEVYDTEDSLVGIFSYDFEVLDDIRPDDSSMRFALVNNNSPQNNQARCNNSEFGECHLDFLMNKLTFESRSGSKNYSNVEKLNNGNYKVTVYTTVFSSEYNNGNSGAAYTVDWNNGNKQAVTLDANTTLTFTAPEGASNLILRIVQDGVGDRTITWPAAVKWPNGVAPTLSVAGSAQDVISCYFNELDYFCSSGLNFR